MKIGVTREVTEEPEEPEMSSTVNDFGTTDFRAATTEPSSFRVLDSVWVVILASRDGWRSRMSMSSMEPKLLLRYQSSSSALSWSVNPRLVFEEPAEDFVRNQFRRLFSSLWNGRSVVNETV